MKRIKQNPFLDSTFTLLFNEQYVPLWKYCLSLVGRPDFAEDIVQDQFVYIWENRERFNDLPSMKSYLFTCVKHRSIDHLRKKYTHNTDNLETFSDNDFNSRLPDPSVILENKELGEIINNAIASLPEKCRIIFTMKKIGGFTNKEIAGQLNISIKTVETQMTISLKKILTYISQNCN